MGIYSEFSHKKIGIFHAYVSLPEGNLEHLKGLFKGLFKGIPFKTIRCLFLMG